MKPTVNSVRKQLNDWMKNKDSSFPNPALRITWQKSVVWPFISKKENWDIIFSDLGDKGDGNYPACPYAAAILVQHMDAFVNYQKRFFNELQRKVPKYKKMKFHIERLKVNKEIIRLSKLNGEAGCGCNLLKNPTTDVRDTKLFPMKGPEPTNAAEALKQVIKSGNTCLAAAVKNTKATTQPSFKNPQSA